MYFKSANLDKSCLFMDEYLPDSDSALNITDMLYAVCCWCIFLCWLFKTFSFEFIMWFIAEYRIYCAFRW